MATVSDEPRIDAHRVTPDDPGRDESPAATRRQRRQQRRARRRWVVVVPSVFVVLIVLTVIGAQLRSGTPDQHTRPAPTGTVAAPVHGAPTLLLAHRAADGHVDLAAVIGVQRGGHDASVLLVPTLTSLEVPSFDLQLVADLLNVGSPSLLQTTISNVLGVRIDHTLVLDDAQLADAMTPAGSLVVDLRDPVTLTGVSEPRTIGTGTQTFTPPDAALLLTDHGSAGELEHLVTVQAILEGWTHALRTPSVAAATTARDPALSTLVAAANASTDYATLPVDGVSAGTGERYQVRPDAIGPAVKGAFPDQLLGIGGERPRVEILNGTGVVGLVQQVAAAVVPAGANVVQTDNYPGFGQTVTRVVYYRDSQRAAATRLLRALGTGKLAREQKDVQVFDVTVIVGSDFKPPAGTTSPLSGPAAPGR